MGAHGQPPSRECPRLQPACPARGRPTRRDRTLQGTQPQGVRRSDVAPVQPCPSQLWSAGILSSDLLATSICQSVTREADQRRRLSRGQEAVRPPTNKMVPGNRGHLQTPGAGEPSETPQCRKRLCQLPPKRATLDAWRASSKKTATWVLCGGHWSPRGGPLREPTCPPAGCSGHGTPSPLWLHIPLPEGG